MRRRKRKRDQRANTYTWEYESFATNKNYIADTVRGLSLNNMCDNGDDDRDAAKVFSVLFSRFFFASFNVRTYVTIGEDDDDDGDCCWFK